jgi:hypothetical protein
MAAAKNAPGTCGLIILLFVSTPSFCQESELLNFEKSIEKAVVATDIPFLEKAYADDFRFKHGTGLVDSKSSWLKSVGAAKGKFISRETDSVEVVRSASRTAVLQFAEKEKTLSNTIW